MYLIFDVGGTKMRLASSFDGENFHDIKIFQTPQDYKKAIDIISDFVAKSSDSSRNGNLLCCGLPGVFDRGKNMLVTAPNLPYWIAKPVKSDLQEITKAQVFLENDAALAGLGEAIKGAGTGSKIVAFLAIGTGVGGARIVDGEIDASVYGFEPGHQIINADVAIAGRMADWESLVSGVGIQTRYGKKAEEIKDRETWAEIEKFVAIGLTNTILHWSPDLVIMGGGLMQSEFISLERIRKNISDVLKVFPSIPEIRKGKLGDEAGPRGGLIYLKGRVSNQI